MSYKKDKMIIRQLDERIKPFLEPGKYSVPAGGWIHAIRTALHMSAVQLSDRLKMTPQGVWQIETSEENGRISIRRLKKVAEAMDMYLVYGFLPKDGSLEAMIEKRAWEIVMRTNPNISDQSTSHGVERLKTHFPERLWDIPVAWPSLHEP